MKNSPNLEKQLTIEMPQKDFFEREDFMVTKSNLEALSFIDEFIKSNQRIGLLVGPPGSGKSHLIKIFMNSIETRLSKIITLPSNNLFNEFEKNEFTIIEDIHNINIKFSEEDLLHAINISKETKRSLIMTSRIPISRFEIRLTDLRSRLESISVAIIEEPDDELMKSIILKMLRDRQLMVNPPIIEFLMKRLERTYLEINRTINLIDKHALEKGKKVSISLIREILN
ncbi:MAG: DnaA/Hda family protein [Pseudomonadota bacterium]|nr:DnaA/Hda family protein [Pseudomonadota bacterium]